MNRVSGERERERYRERKKTVLYLFKNNVKQLHHDNIHSRTRENYE